MDIEEFYKNINEDFSEVEMRLGNKELVTKFITKYKDTNDFKDLSDGIKDRNWEKAFLASHTIKGIALNLGFKKYAKSSSELCELLRPRIVTDLNKLNILFEETKKEYDLITKELKKL